MRRGIRFTVLGILSLLVSSVFLNALLPLSANAMNLPANPLPASLVGMLDQTPFKERIQNYPMGWRTVAPLGKPNFKQLYDATAGASPKVKVPKYKDTWQATVEDVYDNVYEQVSNVNDAWDRNFLDGMAAAYKSLAEGDIGAARAGLQRSLDAGFNSNPSIIPILGQVHYGLKILEDMATYAEVRAVYTGREAELSRRVMNLDAPKTDPTNQTKQLQKPLNMAAKLVNGETDVTVGPNFYGSTYNFYQDFSALWNDVLAKDFSDLSPASEAAALQEAILKAAQKVDSTANAGTGEVGNPCGSPKNFIDKINIPYIITLAMCGLVIFGGQFVDNFMKEAINFLAYTADMLPTQELVAGLVSPTTFLFGTGTLDIISVPIEQELICSPASNVLCQEGAIGPAIQNAFNRVLQLLNVVLIIAFLIIALANILQIQLNNYALKKVLPGLIIGFVMAHGSMFFVRASLEVVGQVTRGLLSVGIPTGAGFVQFSNAFTSVPATQEEVMKPCGPNEAWMTFNCASNGDIDFFKLFRMTIRTVFTAVAAVMVFILAFLLLVRRFIFYALTPLAPLAILGMFFPPLNFIWNRWWKTFSGWLLMPLVAGFWIWLALVWFQAIASSTGFFTSIMGYALGVMALFLAIKTPFNLSGEAKNVMNKWNDVGKASSGWIQRGAGSAAMKVADNTKVGDAIRLARQYKTVRDEGWKEKTKSFWNGPVDQSAISNYKRKRREKGHAALEKWEENYEKNVYAKKKVNGVSFQTKLDARDAATKKVEQLDAQIEKTKLSKGPLAQVALTQLEIEKKKAQNTIDTVNKEVEAHKKKDSEAQKLFEVSIGKRKVGFTKWTPLSGKKGSIEERREWATKHRDEAVSATEWLDRKLKGGKFKVEQKAELIGVREAQNTEMAKRMLVKNGATGYANQFAEIELLKEQTTALADINKDILKKKKEELKQESTYLSELRKRQIRSNADAESALTSSEKAHINRIRDDRQLLQLQLNAEAQKEVREKEMAKALNKQVTINVRNLGTLDRIEELMKSNRPGDSALALKLAASLDDKKNPANNRKIDGQTLGEKVTEMIQDGLYSNNRPNGVTIEDFHKAVKSFSLDPDNQELINRRQIIRHNAKAGEDARNYAESGYHRKVLLERGGKNLHEVMFAQDPGSMDLDSVSSLGSVVRLLQQGDLTGRKAQEYQVAVEGIMAQYQNAQRGTRERQFYDDLSQFRDRLNILATNYTSMTEQQIRNLGRTFVTTESATRLGLDQATANNASQVYGIRLEE